MAGIYIHIPFCKRKCHYCDFYSDNKIGLSGELVESEIKEIILRKDYLNGEVINSIYFGGGSPSMLSLPDLERLIKCLENNFSISRNAEISFECNPDDLNNFYVEGLKKLGINRISLGIQSFDDQVLKILNRRHNAKQGEDAINLIRKNGFTNVSIDLIFGIPGVPNINYETTLSKAILYGLEHISAYNLNIEPKTVFYKQMINHTLVPLNEDDILFQFDLTIERLKDNGYHHYEVSNYAKRNFESNHNLLYWNNGKYLGIGPSAHSYDQESRQWNISNTAAYISLMKNKKSFFERELLTEENKYNEYILTSLRTSKGISEDYIFKNFNTKIYNHFKNKLHSITNKDLIKNIDNGNIRLDKKGLFILDFIISKFYYN